MRRLEVGLGARSYPILIGAGLLERTDLIAERMMTGRAVVISNEIVAPLYGDVIVGGLSKLGIEVAELVLPDGEATKAWPTLDVIYEYLLRKRAERSTTLIALGGGVTGDIVGFAAATYQRGVPFIQIPTTLLAQVDSSVGGKTAINHPIGKNMIGAFHQPRLVLTDTRVLHSLPERELRAGLAEVIKYGLIRDEAFFSWLESNLERLTARDPDALEYAIERSCRNKAEVVVEDETESGVRALLNLGHTFGHAIETGLGYGVWLHGEAVAAGMAMAVELSRRLGWLTVADSSRILDLLSRAGLPTKGPRLGSAQYLDMMYHDKKVSGGTLRLVLLSKIGAAKIFAEANLEDIIAAIDARSDG